MPDFSIIAVTTARGADEAELDVVVADFDDASEAKGYARRLAEETHGLAAQLNLDFDYSHVSVYEGEVEPDTAETSGEAQTGAWLFVDDGIEWASADSLDEAPADAPDEPAAGHA